MNRYPRNMIGYGAQPPQAQWPGGAKVAVQFVLNYEEGGENCILHGDAASEAFLSDIAGAAPWPGMRHWNMESIYEYGARAGFWRLHRPAAGRPLAVSRTWVVRYPSDMKGSFSAASTGSLAKAIAQDRGKCCAVIVRKLFIGFLENHRRKTVIEFCQNMRGP